MENKKYRCHIIPYAHTDYAWTNSRQWHIQRYLLIAKEVIDVLKKNTSFTWMTDNYSHFLKPVIDNMPYLVEDINRFIKEGRFEITNLVISLLRSTTAGEETFIRNIILGRKLIKRLFPSAESLVYHNVDVSLGHSQLPQLLKMGGYRYMRIFRPQGVMDSKGIPGEFIWKGADGSSIICSRGIYAGFTDSGRDISEEIEDIKKRSNVPVLWVPMGMDDTRPMADYKDNPLDFESNMEVNFSTAYKYFEELKNHDLPVIEGIIDPCDVSYNMPSKGEKGLWRLRQTLEPVIIKGEILSSLVCLKGGEYKESEINDLWLSLLSISGHAMDFLMKEDYQKVYSLGLSSCTKGRKLIHKSLKALVKSEALDNRYLLFNPLNWRREDPMEISFSFPEGSNGFQLFDSTGNKIDYQLICLNKGDITYRNTSFNEAKAVINTKIPPMGYTFIRVKEINESKTMENFNLVSSIDFHINSPVQTINNGKLIISFSKGRIIRVLDVSGHLLYDDTNTRLNEIKYVRTMNSSANSWLFNSHQTGEDEFIVSSYFWEEYGPLRSKYVCEGKIGNNSIRKETFIYKDRRDLNFITHITCGENDKGYFTASFPSSDSPDIEADIPFGYEKRDINIEPYGMITDNPVDNLERLIKGFFYAKSWVRYTDDFSEKSLISIDCGKYYINDDKKISLILTKILNPKDCQGWERNYPEEMDCMGRHSFKYSLVFSNKSLSNYDIHKIAKEKIYPCDAIRVHNGSEESFSLFDIKGDISVTSFYKDGEYYILRFYEASGKDADVCIQCAYEIEKAYVTDFNLNEMNKELNISDKTIRLKLESMEIISIAIKFHI